MLPSSIGGPDVYLEIDYAEARRAPGSWRGSQKNQAELALAVRKRLPLAALQGLAKAGLSDQEIEQFVIPQRTRRHRAEKKQPKRSGI